MEHCAVAHRIYGALQLGVGVLAGGGVLVLKLFHPALFCVSVFRLAANQNRCVALLRVNVDRANLFQLANQNLLGFRLKTLSGVRVRLVLVLTTNQDFFLSVFSGSEALIGVNVLRIVPLIANQLVAHGDDARFVALIGVGVALALGKLAGLRRNQLIALVGVNVSVRRLFLADFLQPAGQLHTAVALFGVDVLFDSTQGSAASFQRQRRHDQRVHRAEHHHHGQRAQHSVSPAAAAMLLAVFRRLLQHVLFHR